MENRSALIVDTCLTSAGDHAERIAALAMIEPRADRSSPRIADAGGARFWRMNRYADHNSLSAVGAHRIKLRLKEAQAARTAVTSPIGASTTPAPCR